MDKLEYGWICPKCGRVNAPWIASCPCSCETPCNMDFSGITPLSTPMENNGTIPASISQPTVEMKTAQTTGGIKKKTVKGKSAVTTAGRTSRQGNPVEVTYVAEETVRHENMMPNITAVNPKDVKDDGLRVHSTVHSSNIHTGN